MCAVCTSARVCVGCASACSWDEYARGTRVRMLCAPVCVIGVCVPCVRVWKVYVCGRNMCAWRLCGSVRGVCIGRARSMCVGGWKCARAGRVCPQNVCALSVYRCV